MSDHNDVEIEIGATANECGVVYFLDAHSPWLLAKREEMMLIVVDSVTGAPKEWLFG